MSGYLERFVDEDQGSGLYAFQNLLKQETLSYDNCEQDMLVFSSRGTLT